MGKLQKNQKGFTAVEGLLIVLILVVIGAVGYMVYHNEHKTKALNASTSASTTSTKSTVSNNDKTVSTVNPYAGWKSYELPNDKLSFMYPSDWSIDTPRPISPISSTQDFVQFKAADGFYFDISDGGYQYGTNGSYLASSTIPTKFISQSCYLVFEYSSSYPHGPNQTGGVTVSNLAYGGILLTNASNQNSLPNDQNAVGTNTFDGTSNSKAISISFAFPTPITVAEATSNSDTKNTELVIASMHY